MARFELEEERNLLSLANGFMGLKSGARISLILAPTLSLSSNQTHKRAWLFIFASSKSGVLIMLANATQANNCVCLLQTAYCRHSWLSCVMHRQQQQQQQRKWRTKQQQQHRDTEHSLSAQTKLLPPLLLFSAALGPH